MMINSFMKWMDVYQEVYQDYEKASMKFYGRVISPVEG